MMQKVNNSLPRASILLPQEIKDSINASLADKNLGTREMMPEKKV